MGHRDCTIRQSGDIAPDFPLPDTISNRYTNPLHNIEGALFRPCRTPSNLESKAEMNSLKAVFWSLVVLVLTASGVQAGESDLAIPNL